MIYLFSGDTRSGKSHNVVEYVIIPAMQQGRVVVTNIPLKMNGSISLLQEDFPKGSIIYFDKMEPLEVKNDIKLGQVEIFNQSFFMNHERFPKGAVFVIDECWRYWPAGIRANEISVDNNSFFTEHGHRLDFEQRESHIYLVTQSYDQIATFARSLINKTYHTTKQDHLGKLGSSRYVVSIHEKHLGINKKAYKEMSGKYTEKVWRYYYSHTDSNVSKTNGVVQEPIDKRGNALLPKLKLLLGLVIVLAFMIYWISGFFPDTDTVETSVSVNDSGESVGAVGAVVSSSSFALPFGENIVIKGSYYIGVQSYVFQLANGLYLNSIQLIRMGYVVESITDCQANLIDSSGVQLKVFCGFLGE